MMNTSRTFIALLTIAVFAILILLSASSKVSIALADDGAAIFKAKCATCHGTSGSGDTPAGKSLKVRDLRSADVQKQTDVELTKVISGGKGKMPPYGKQISVQGIEALIAYIRTLKGK